MLPCHSQGAVQVKGETDVGLRSGPLTHPTLRPLDLLCIFQNRKPKPLVFQKACNCYLLWDVGADHKDTTTGVLPGEPDRTVHAGPAALHARQ